MVMTMKLFAVVLGGRAKGCNTELHDVVFAAGETIEHTHAQLPAKWFGVRKGLHVDAWHHLDIVDGYCVHLSAEPSAGAERLWFINIGGYAPGQLAELHATTFVVATSRMSAKMKGRARLKHALPEAVHVDDVDDVDDCLQLGLVDGLHVVLEPTTAQSETQPLTAYVPLKAR